MEEKEIIEKIEPEKKEKKIIKPIPPLIGHLIKRYLGKYG